MFSFIITAQLVCTHSPEYSLHMEPWQCFSVLLFSHIPSFSIFCHQSFIIKLCNMLGQSIITMISYKLTDNCFD